MDYKIMSNRDLLNQLLSGNEDAELIEECMKRLDKANIEY